MLAMCGCRLLPHCASINSVRLIVKPCHHPWYSTLGLGGGKARCQKPASPRQQALIEPHECDSETPKRPTETGDNSIEDRLAYRGIINFFILISCCFGVNTCPFRKRMMWSHGMEADEIKEPARGRFQQKRLMVSEP